jgi:hypothetical protein
LLWRVPVAAGVVLDSGDAEASLRDVLAAALEANRELARLAGELGEENARLRAENAGQATELGKLFGQRRQAAGSGGAGGAAGLLAPAPG